MRAAYTLHEQTQRIQNGTNNQTNQNERRRVGGLQAIARDRVAPKANRQGCARRAAEQASSVQPRVKAMTAYYNKPNSKRYFTGKECRRGHIAERYKATRSCVECVAERCKEWQKLNKRKYLDAQNESRRVRLFGINRDKYNEMLLSQGGGCAICSGPNRGGRMLAIDHDHACCPGEKTCGKCVRGLLCDSCNHAIGKFKDDPDLLIRAARYLNHDQLLQ